MWFVGSGPCQSLVREPETQHTCLVIPLYVTEPCCIPHLCCALVVARWSTGQLRILVQSTVTACMGMRQAAAELKTPVPHRTWASILLQSVSYGQLYGITGSYWCGGCLLLPRNC